MGRYHSHVLMSVLTALGLVAIGAVLVVRSGVDIYAIGFVVLGTYSLGTAAGPLVLPDRFHRPRVSRKRLAVDVLGIVLVGLTLGLLVFERTDLASQISV